jgi:hypothetical protein
MGGTGFPEGDALADGQYAEATLTSPIILSSSPSSSPATTGIILKAQ